MMHFHCDKRKILIFNTEKSKMKSSIVSWCTKRTNDVSMLIRMNYIQFKSSLNLITLNQFTLIRFLSNILQKYKSNSNRFLVMSFYLRVIPYKLWYEEETKIDSIRNKWKNRENIWCSIELKVLCTRNPFRYLE